MQERRKAQAPQVIPEELWSRAGKQLAREISIIEGWLRDLNGTREGNEASLAARKSYSDMLQSRRELLHSLYHKHRH